MSQSLSPRKEIERKIDLYDQNIQLLVALAKIFSYRFADAKNTIGKPMKDRSRPKDDPVTPDLVTEFSEESRRSKYAILSEAKKSFPRDKKSWIEDADQLKSYDAEFEDWEKTHDILLVTDGMLVEEFWNYLNTLAEKDTKYVFRHSLALFSFARDTDNGNARVFVRREFGSLSDPEVAKKMERNRPILINILRQAEAIKFYDQKPEIPYTMAILWDFIISKEKGEDEYADFPIDTPIPIDINCTATWEQIKARFAPPENQGVVKRGWIKEALDKFVEVKLAKRLPDDANGENYQVFYRKRRRNASPTRNFLLDVLFGKEVMVDEGQSTLDSFPP